MEAEKNKAVVARFYEEAWNKKNLSVIDETHAPDYELGRLQPWRKHGAEGLKEFIADNHRMFPDVHINIDDLIGEGDKVAMRMSATATHKGDLVGPVGLVKATNKKVNWYGIFIFQLKEYKIVKAWGVTDNMDLMQQLGAVKKP